MTGTLKSFRTIITVIGSNDPERQGLAKRRVMKLLAPQVAECPLYFHLTDSSSKAFRKVMNVLFIPTRKIVLAIITIFTTSHLVICNHYLTKFVHSNSRFIHCKNVSIL